MTKYVDTDGLLYFWQKIKNQFAKKTDVPGASSTSPKMNGTAAVGTETTWAHGDHVHPTDTTRAPIASPTFTGTPSAPTAATGTNTTQIATTAFVKSAIDTLDTGVTSVAGKTGAVTLTKSDISDLATVTTTANDTGLMTAADKTKLNGIATGAEVNQNAFSNVKVGSTTVAADGKTDTLELVAGTNVTLTPDDTNDKITITATDTTYSAATTSANGLMSSSDKTKLNGIATGAEVNQNAFSNIAIGDATIAADTKTDTLTFVAGSNVTLTPDATNDKVTIAATDTTYSDATTSAHGLMTAADKTKLNGVATGAEVNQNAFSNVKVGSTTVAADAKTDTLEFAGSNVTLTPDATNDKVTIGITASNVTTALGNTAVSRATADASGNNIADTYAKKTDIASMYKYKGSVATASALPESPTTGDVYNIEAASTYGAAGANVAWNGTAWDSLGEIFTIQAITNAEIDTIVAS